MLFCPTLGARFVTLFCPSLGQDSATGCIWLAQGSREDETVGRGGGSYWYQTLEPLGEPLSARLRYSLNTIDLISQYNIILTITINFWWEDQTIWRQQPLLYRLGESTLPKRGGPIISHN